MSEEKNNIVLSEDNPLNKFVLERGIMIPAVQLYPNTGQIPGVPKNHMTITEKGEKDLDNSLKEDPEFLFANPLTVVPYAGAYVVVAGNQRRNRGTLMGFTEFPCDVLNPLISPEKLKRFILKDNINYGVVDWDVLANEWEMEIEELQHIGMYLPDIEIPDEPEAAPDPNSSEQPSAKLTLNFKGNLDQFDRVKEVILNAIEGFDYIELK